MAGSQLRVTRTLLTYSRIPHTGGDCSNWLASLHVMLAGLPTCRWNIGVENHMSEQDSISLLYKLIEFCVDGTPHCHVVIRFRERWHGGTADFDVEGIHPNLQVYTGLTQWRNWLAYVKWDEEGIFGPITPDDVHTAPTYEEAVEGLQDGLGMSVPYFEVPCIELDRLGFLSRLQWCEGLVVG